MRGRRPLPKLVTKGVAPLIGQLATPPLIRQLGEMARVLASSDAVAVLSPWETFGLSAVEAMASGAALLGSAKMSIGELLQTCRCGIGLDEVTPRAVADAWLELMRPGRAALLGARGHQEANARYSWKTTFARIADVYGEVVDAAGARQRLLDLLGPDMMPLMARTGFDAVVLRADQDRGIAERQLGFFGARGHYQGDVQQTKPVFGRAA